jgi:hypothetical protein
MNHKKRKEHTGILCALRSVECTLFFTSKTNEKEDGEDVISSYDGATLC